MIGGEDLTSPPIAVNPSNVYLARNYTPTSNGLRRVGGYERYDGRDAPSNYTDPVDQEAKRALIQAVPGSGPVRGVWIFKDNTYAFRDSTDGLSGKMYRATSSGWVEVAASAGKLSPGGRYEFVNFNFGGHASTEAMYGVNGVNKAFQYDGTTFTLITTGMTTDKPTHLAVHQNYLWLTFAGGSLQNSPLGNPTGTWTPLTGANEFGIGAEITGLVNAPGDTLVIFCRNKTYLLTGADSSTFQLRAHSRVAGAIEWSIVNLNGVKALNDFGGFDLRATDAFGDFEDATYTDLVRPLMASLLPEYRTAVVLRADNQLWHLGETIGVVSGWNQGKLIGVTRLTLGIKPRCAVSDFISGTERVFVGCDDGFVYELNAGPSFDGDPIETNLKLPYNAFKNPSIRKRIRQLTLDIQAQAEFDIKFQVDFDFADANVRAEPMVEETIEGVGGFWNVSYWDTFVWSGVYAAQPTAYVAGTCRNVSVYLYTKTTYEPAFTLNAVTWRYCPRRLNR
jgi:hypothetical protein